VVDMTAEQTERAFRARLPWLQEAFALYSSMASSGMWAIPFTIT
jgi:hypothetical protein